MPGDAIGLVDFLRQESCEIAIARQPCKLFGIPIELVVKLIGDDRKLQENFALQTSPCEGAKILSLVYQRMNPVPGNPKEWILGHLSQNKVSAEKKKLLSTAIQDQEELIGREISEEQFNNLEKLSAIPIRMWVWNISSSESITQKDSNNKGQDPTKIKSIENKDWVPKEGLDLNLIGLKDEDKTSKELLGFKLLRGSGSVYANLAVIRMIGRAYETPCPVDVIEKALEGAAERANSIPLQGMGQLAEIMGLQTQVGEVSIEKIKRLELPVITKWERHYALITEAKDNFIRLADPEKGWVELHDSEIREAFGEKIKVLLLKRLKDTPTKTFGWEWFTPVIRKFQIPLVQVLLASLFIQLFQLANPLLLQQIIDKVITQSNLSALQVLGGALVVAALFQGLLTAVRTWLLIDTTDRMDLILGSQVIDRLLRLPLRFFEKRPVGELSQRLSELTNLRSFLTGTAITSALDLLFATIYILIMVIYSPILTAVALSTVPVYVIMILFIAPLYRRLIRSQAQYAARTQSHLIETLSGIQTVKAQHFELNSRWRWQERYSGQIAEGFKSVVLGSSVSEIGNFLNQLSSLLIIWVGVYLVVKGELSLGQLIAFRIIAGYVTGPILRLSSLWQGFQQVGISMERLGDIVDQVPETGENDTNQISLPPIKGDVRFENLSFRFSQQGQYQIDGVDLEIKSGSFIGIVGQSGSGKSTLMKLLPRLYEPEKGKILIDNYDISKVNLGSIRQQVGIVPQDCLLFEGSIMDNITMNYPEATNETVVNAARIAAAHDFIMELPDGYNTKIGERGAGLSGGQRQRIAIARTILENPNLLVLDEATSALDYDTESTVCQNLQGWLKTKTVFFITHRLSTVKRADKIILMHKGKIDEVGTHKELMENKGRYFNLYSQQGDE